MRESLCSGLVKIVVDNLLLHTQRETAPGKLVMVLVQCVTVTNERTDRERGGGRPHLKGCVLLLCFVLDKRNTLAILFFLKNKIHYT